MVDCKHNVVTVDIEPRVTDIRDAWDWVKTGVEEILAEQSQLTFRPEDVYAECLKGNAVLWTTSEGFIVSTTLVDSFNREETFLVWLAWAKKRGGNCVVKHFPFFQKKAREAGYKHIEVRSPVKAMNEYLTQQNWSIDTVVYKRGL
jgi:hypothetical protein